MKFIKLTKGYETIIDNEDYAELSKYKWCACVKPNRVYAQRRNSENKIVYMHRQIMKYPKKAIDHINRNGLDNRKINLREASRSENGQNCGPRKRKHGKYKGTEKAGNRWQARIRVNWKRISLGMFKTEEEAALAYNRAALKFFGDSAFINNIKKENI